MLKEIYAIPNGEKRYKENVVELTNELDVIIQQIDLLLFTNKGDVLLMQNSGVIWNVISLKLHLTNL